MKLTKFKQETGFVCALTFENGEHITVNLEPLIGNFISAEQLGSGEIDPEWGCLQFQEGSIDIEPATLYRYALHSSTAGGASTVAQPEHQPERTLAGRR
jgi:hypothetical protein